MAASVNDYFKKLGSATSLVNSPKVTVTRAGNGTTLTVDNCNWDTTTGKVFATYKVDTSNNVVANSETIWVGVVNSSTSIGSLSRVAGASDTGNSIGDIVELLPSSKWANDLMAGILVQHKQDGTHSNITADSITTTTLTVNSATTTAGYNALGVAPTTITALGNRSYTILFPGVNYTDRVSAGMRLQTTRTVAAPTQCTSLNGTTQYYSKTTPAGMTFTNNFVVSAWIKVAAYSGEVIASRYNGTSGWDFILNSSGQVKLSGYNAGAANFSQVLSYQSVPLNKWVHVTAQLDMATFTATSTTSYVMIDGIDVPAAVSRGGTNPTALVQAGNLEIGSEVGGTGLFNGKLAQVAIYSAKVTQATILASIHQGLAGTETSLISAYSFNNSINDLNANANNLTANGSAVATNADSPFGGQADGTISSTLDYAIITKTAFSTNTTLTVQVPEGCTIPTSGGVSAVSYSTQKAPYLFPAQTGKWRISSMLGVSTSTTSNATYGSFSSDGYQLVAPVGEWNMGHRGNYYNSTTTTVSFNIASTTAGLSGLTVITGQALSPFTINAKSAAAASAYVPAVVQFPVSLSAATTYRMYTVGATTSAGIEANTGLTEIFAELALL